MKHASQEISAAPAHGSDRSQRYDSRFFAALSAGSASSAAQILPEVVRLIAPKSAVDLGCGTGEWLGELRKLGVTDVMGVDGDWVDRATLKQSQLRGMEDDRLSRRHRDVWRAHREISQQTLRRRTEIDPRLELSERATMTTKLKSADIVIVSKSRITCANAAYYQFQIRAS